MQPKDPGSMPVAIDPVVNHKLYLAICFLVKSMSIQEVQPGFRHRQWTMESFIPNRFPLEFTDIS